MINSRIGKQWLAVLAVVGATAFAGCRDGGEPDALMAPQFSEAAADTTYTLIEGEPPEDVDTLSVSKVIDERGGDLKIAGHRLSVPKKAVTEPTTFTMTVLDDGYVAVDLTATRINAAGDTIDVGEEGFDEKLNLKMTYEWASNVDEGKDLMVGWLEDGSYDGDIVAQRSSVDKKAQWVIVKLEHFSKYCLISN